MESHVTIASLCFVPGVALGLFVAPGCALALAAGGLVGGWMLCGMKRSRDLYGLLGLALMLFSAGMLCAARWNQCGEGLQPAFAVRCANALRSLIESLDFTNPDTPALLKAFLTGDRSSLSENTLDTFRASGASHLLALSGLHMGIIYMLLKRIFSIAGGHPAAKLVSGVGVILLTGFFTLMTGASPSCVRAFLFISISEIARLTHRQASPLHCLSLALLIQLCISPGNITKAGFQLSYLAVLGICLLFPPLRRLYPAGSSLDPFRKVWDMASLSISCQVFTAPLSWKLFHSFPQYFLITNLLALPLMTFIMLSSIITLVLAGFGLRPAITTQATELLCGLLVKILEIISSL